MVNNSHFHLDFIVNLVRFPVVKNEDRLRLTMLYHYKARFPFKRNRLRCVRCVNENRKKRKRLRLNGNRA